MTARGSVTREELARRIGVHKNTLANYEINKRVPDAHAINAICDALGVAREWLLTGEGEMMRDTNVQLNTVLLTHIIQDVERATKQHASDVDDGKKAKIIAAAYGVVASSGDYDSHRMTMFAKTLL